MLSNMLFRRIRYSDCKIVYHTLIQNIKYKNPVIYKSFHSSFKHMSEIETTRKYEKLNTTFNKMDINTNVQNNVILYKNKNIKDFVILRIIFFSWTICNIILFSCYYDSIFILTWNEYSFNEYIKHHGLNIFLFGYSVLLGPVCAAILYMLNHQFIKYIILHKGGQEVSLLTNHLLKNFRTITVPVKQIKTDIARDKMKGYLSLKIKGHYFSYYVDGTGKFLNNELFDYTVGRAKKW